MRRHCVLQTKGTEDLGDAACQSLTAHDLVTLGWAAPSSTLSAAVQNASSLIPLPQTSVGTPSAAAMLRTAATPIAQTLQLAPAAVPKQPISSAKVHAQAALPPCAATALQQTAAKYQTDAEQAMASLRPASSQPAAAARSSVLGGNAGLQTLREPACCSHLLASTRMGNYVISAQRSSDALPAPQSRGLNSRTLDGGISAPALVTSDRLAVAPAPDWLRRDLIEVAENNSAVADAAEVAAKAKVVVFFTSDTIADVCGSSKQVTVKPGAYEARVTEVRCACTLVQTSKRLHCHNHVQTASAFNFKSL